MINKINEANAPVKGHKPILKIKLNKSLTKDMYLLDHLLLLRKLLQQEVRKKQYFFILLLIEE